MNVKKPLKYNKKKILPKNSPPNVLTATPKPFHLKSRSRQGSLLWPLQFDFVLSDLVNIIKKKVNNWNKHLKREINTMYFCWYENPRDPNVFFKSLKLIREFKNQRI